MLKWLLDHSYTFAPSLICDVIAAGKLELVKELAPLTISNWREHSDSVLSCACQSGSVEVLQFVLSKGAVFAPHFCPRNLFGSFEMFNYCRETFGKPVIMPVVAKAMIISESRLEILKY